MHQAKKPILINTQWNENFRPKIFETQALNRNVTQISDFNLHWTATFGTFVPSSQQNALLL